MNTNPATPTPTRNYGDLHDYVRALKAHRRMLEGWVGGHPVAAALAFVAVYALIVAFSVPDGALMTLAGGFLFGTWEGGISMFDGERFTTYTTDDGLASNHVATIYEDRQGTLWFGFEWSGGGVSRLVDAGQNKGCQPSFITYTADDGLLDNMVYDIIQDEEGHLWFAHLNSGLTCYDPETLRVVTGVPVTHTLIQDQEGRLWFGSSNALCCTGLDASETYRVQTFNTIVLRVMEDSKGGFWVGTQDEGLYHYESAKAVWEGAGKQFTTQNGLNYDTVLSLLETKDGRIWAGTWGPWLSLPVGR